MGIYIYIVKKNIFFYGNDVGGVSDRVLSSSTCGHTLLCFVVNVNFVAFFHHLEPITIKKNMWDNAYFQ